SSKFRDIFPLLGIPPVCYSRFFARVNRNPRKPREFNTIVRYPKSREPAPRLGLLPPVVAMYGDVVLELKPLDRTERDPFEVILEEKKLAYGMSLDTDAALRK
ncbi:MAG TPA: hypothetical protein VHP60_03960, partial [Thermoanaerobaculia bacterium]|nr:hypothetical protein [Thermoanaerobaculia bacterium]